ncbi:uncharacterized protein LOC107046880, partial [Diachasma alloeum]|uniref:uncharacterized protein LOC107046880 n=1 Tax=Diachasma alloeum TaxID=454923 RepID=UPI0007383E14
METERVIEILEYAYKNASLHETQRWMDWCGHYIKLYGKVLKKVNLSVGEKNKVQATIATIEYYLEKFRYKQHRGGRLDPFPHSVKLTERVRWKDLQSVFQGRIRTGTIVNLHHKDPLKFLKDAKKLATVRLKNVLESAGNMKVNSILACKFEVKRDEELVQETKFFSTRNEIILPDTDIGDWFEVNVIECLLTKIEDFQERDSGWNLVEVIHLVINMNRYIPLAAGISTYTELPHDIQCKKAVVNLKNSDEFCFLWSVIAALHPVNTNKCVTSSYPHYSTAKIPNTNVKLDYRNLQFPIALNDVAKFESKNGLSINVYGIEGASDDENSQIVPFHLSSVKSERPTIHLLLFCSSIHVAGDIQPIYHFAWIRDLSRLVSAQISSHAHRTWLCDRCLCHFQEKRSYERHQQDCFAINHCKTVLPREGENLLSFKNYKYKETVPFVIYADLECILESINGDDNGNEDGMLRQKHIPHSVAFYLKCSFNDDLSKFKLKRDPQCIKWLVEELQDIGLMVNDYLRTVIPMEKLSIERKQEFQSAEVCHICEKSFISTDVKHRDHCHFTGSYHGAAHAGCNLNYKNSHDIPVIFHNLSGYDAHFLIKDLARDFSGAIELLPINKEKYISFRKHIPGTKVYLRFIDSFRFMASSLEKLASYLSDSDKQITRRYYNNDEEKFSLLMRKGVFPYEYVNSWERLEELNLPEKDYFHSTLKNQGISDEDYAHQVWMTFKLSTLGEYSDLYLQTDVLLLVDIFENFRKSCTSVYQLDPLHYYTAPGLAFDAMLKCTNVEIELFTDVEKLLFIEKGIRGGVAQCVNRYAHANNRYMDNFEADKPESYLMYYDVNNLYGAAMSRHLPYGSFEWVDLNEEFDVLKISDDSPIGYFLEVDLSYPRELYYLHSDLPLCPEHFVPPNRKNSKLMTTLYDKK